MKERDKHFCVRKENGGSRTEDREKQIPSKNENLRNKEHTTVYFFAMIQCIYQASVSHKKGVLLSFFAVFNPGFCS